MTEQLQNLDFSCLHTDGLVRGKRAHAFLLSSIVYSRWLPAVLWQPQLYQHLGGHSVNDSGLKVKVMEKWGWFAFLTKPKVRKKQRWTSNTEWSNLLTVLLIVPFNWHFCKHIGKPNLHKAGEKISYYFRLLWPNLFWRYWIHSGTEINIRILSHKLHFMFQTLTDFFRHH